MNQPPPLPNPVPPVLPPQPAQPLQPTPSAERIELLDALRGFALLGILLVNMELFSDSFYVALTGPRHHDALSDQIAARLVSFFAERKFYTIFSFLFGVGAAIQLTRITARNRRFGAFFCRRMIILLGIGLAHSIFVWEGDILTNYALMGLFLPLFARRRQLTVLVWAVVLISVPIVINQGSGSVVGIVSLIPESADQMDEALESEFEDWWDEAETDDQIYGSGDYLSIVARRCHNLLWESAYSLVYMPAFLGLFLLGFWTGRMGALQQPLNHKRCLVAAAWVLTGTGLLLNLACLAGEGSEGLFWYIIEDTLMTIGGLTLGLGYVALVALAWQRRPGSTPWRLLAPVGRMALTNYLLQSMIGTTLFYGYGLGWYGESGPAFNLAIALAIFALQIPFSHWWLRRFPIGPAEWLWRRLTYGQA